MDGQAPENQGIISFLNQNRIVIAIVILLLFGITLSIAGATFLPSLMLYSSEDDGSTEVQPLEQADVVLRFFGEVLNQRNWETADQIIAPNIVHHDEGQDINGLVEFNTFITSLHDAFPDGAFSIDDIIVEGDKTVIRYTFQGTHEGEFSGVPPTEKDITVTGIVIIDVANGKIQEMWNTFDNLGALAQIEGVELPWVMAHNWGTALELNSNEAETIGLSKSEIRNGFETLWNTGNPSIVDNEYSPEFVNHDTTHAEVQDHEAYKFLIRNYREAIPDLLITVEDVLIEGDKAVLRWRATAHNFDWGGITIFRFSGDMIVEAWWSREALTLVQQAGLIQEN